MFKTLKLKSPESREISIDISNQIGMFTYVLAIRLYYVVLNTCLICSQFDIRRRTLNMLFTVLPINDCLMMSGAPFKREI